MNLYRLLQRLNEQGELADFVEAELGPILEHDSRSTAPLLPTVDAFVRFGGNKARTSAELFIQRRSLYYRLNRIEMLLGRSVNSMDSQVRLYLAMRGLEVLNRPPRR
jgi:purine catabolism regulator